MSIARLQRQIPPCFKNECRFIIHCLLHAKGIDIGIYTTDFENEFISLTDIEKYRNVDDPRFVMENQISLLYQSSTERPR